MNIIYNIVSIALIGICIFAGFKDHITLAILCFIASLAFLFIANLKNIKKAKASKDGFEIEARELIQKAEVTITEMQDLAKLVSKTALSLIKKRGQVYSWLMFSDNGKTNPTLLFSRQLIAAAEL